MLRLCVSRKGGIVGGGWGHPQAVHMAAAGLGCEVDLVVTEWDNSCPGYMNGLRKHYSHLVVRFISGKEGCSGSEITGHKLLD